MSFKYTIYGMDEYNNPVIETIELKQELSSESIESMTRPGFDPSDPVWANATIKDKSYRNYPKG